MEIVPGEAGVPAVASIGIDTDLEPVPVVASAAGGSEKETLRQRLAKQHSTPSP